MVRLSLSAAILAGCAAGMLSVPAAAADVGVSISVGQPGFYGRIDIGGVPPPPVIYAQPVIVAPPPVERPPIYLRVPPGYAKHWSRHCHEFNACGERVYFVQDGWYRNDYVPRYRELHRDHHGEYRDDRHDEPGYRDHGNHGDRRDHRDHPHGGDRDSGR